MFFALKLTYFAMDLALCTVMLKQEGGHPQTVPTDLENMKLYKMSSYAKALRVPFTGGRGRAL